MEIDGQDVILRPIRVADSEGPYLRWLNDPEINQYLESRFVSWDTQELRVFIDRVVKSSDEFLFAICLKETKAHIGNIKLGPVNWNHRFGDIGIFIGEKDQWGRGRAVAAISALCTYGFDELGLNKLTAGCYEENRGSLKAFTRVGFKQEGIVRRKFISPQGYQDHILLGLLKDEFKR